MKYKKIMFMLVLAIFIFGAASVCATDVNDTVVANDDSAGELSQADTDNVISSDEDEKIAKTENVELIGNASKGNFSELRDLIYAAPAGSTIVLDKDYECEDGFRIDGIRYEKFLTIDGNGHTLDARGNSRVFEIHESGVLKNINFINGNGGAGWGIAWFKYDGTVINCTFTNGFCEHGAGVYITETGTVINCTFDGNTASDEGGAIWIKRGSVTNCTFINNSALGNYGDGGAICTWSTISLTNCTFINNYGRDGGAVNLAGPVINCTFINNTAWRDGGAVYDWGKVNAINCTFTGNAANRNGGAFYFRDMDEYANVINCSFNGNNASAGSAIYFDSGSVSKTLTNCILLDNRVNAALNVIKNENNLTITLSGYDNLLTAIYSPGAVTFNNVTYYGLKEITNTDSSATKPSRSNVAYRQNVTVFVIDGNAIEVNETLITDDNGMAVVPIDIEHDSYYISVSHSANTYYNTVEKIIAQFTVNITSQETDNKTVNLTAKCIYNLPMPGYMQFVMPNGDKVRANYDSKGNWWALYTFDSAGVHEVSGTYVGLDNVTFNNGNITIYKSNSTIDFDDITVEYNVTENFTVPTEGAIAITASIDGTNVTVIDNFTVPTSDLAVGNYTLTVTTIPDDDHYSVTGTYKITVIKARSTVTVDDIVFDYNSEGSTNVSYTGATGITAIVVGQPKAVVNISGNKITVSGLAGGNYTLRVTTNPDENHSAVTKNANITVNKLSTEIIIANETFDLKVTDEGTISANLTPAGAGNPTFTSGNESVIKVSDDGSFIAAGEGKATVTVSFAGNENYTEAENKTVTFTVTLNDASVSAEDIVMNAGDNVTIAATTTPDGLKITYIPDNSGVVTVSDGVVTGVKGGTATVTLKVGGDGIYAENSTTITVTVNKLNTTISVNDKVDMYVDDDVNVNATLSPAVAGELNYVSSDESVVTVNSNGELTAVANGTANITVSFSGNDQYLPAESKTVTVTVSKIPTVISGKDYTQYTVDYKIGERGQNFTVQLKDVNGNPVANKTVLIAYSDKVLNRTTDENGYARVQINFDYKLKIPFTVTFEGDNKYEPTVSKYTITTNLKPVTITASAKTFKASAKTKKYTVTLKTIKGASADGKTYFASGKKVTMKINGKTYTAKTNSKGQATFSLKITKKAKFTATIKFAGDKTYKAAKKSVKITIK